MKAATMSSAEREALVVERRANRVPFRVIGQELGISESRAHAIFKECRDRLPIAALSTIRIEEAELADRAIADLLTIAENTHVSPRTRAEAWNSIRGWSESKRKLFGADAPTRREITVVSDDTIDNAISELEREMERVDQQVKAAKAARVPVPVPA